MATVTHPHRIELIVPRGNHMSRYHNLRHWGPPVPHFYAMRLPKSARQS